MAKIYRKVYRIVLEPEKPFDINKVVNILVTNNKPFTAKYGKDKLSKVYPTAFIKHIRQNRKQTF